MKIIYFDIMNKQIDTIKKTRLFLLDLVKDLSVDQLNEIPSTFNNNIVWNLGHLIASHQGVCYLRAGAKPVVDEKYIATYKPGTKPGEHINDKELSIIKDIMVSSIDKFQIDYQNNVFANYNGWNTRYGVELAALMMPLNS